MSASKTKVAIYSGVIPSTTFIERLISGVADQNFEIQLFGAQKTKQKYKQNVKCLGYRNIRIHKAFYLFYYTLLLSLFKHAEKQKLDRILKNQTSNLRRARLNAYPVLWHRPDIFHVQWAKSLQEWTWVKTYGIKLVLSLRGAHINYSPIADKALASSYLDNFPKVDAFHAVSEAIANESTKYGADTNKIEVIYSGMDLVSDQLIKKNNKVLKIISIGRAHWKKGFTYALDACKILNDKGFSFQYNIVGVQDAIELQYQIKDLDLKNEVKLVKGLPFDEVIQLIRSADLLLLPSTEEGIANVVIEAMFCGTLVLSTNCGGMSELIEDQNNGFLVPIRDAKAIASKINLIASLTDQEKTNILANAKSDALKKHNLQSMVDGMSKLYERVEQIDN